MKKGHFVTLSIIAGLIGLWIILTKIDINDIFRAFKDAPVHFIVGYIVIHFLIMATQTWRWQVVIKSQEKKSVSLWHLFWYKVVGYGVSFLTPTAKVGGEPVRAGLLKRDGIKFKNALSTVVIDKTLELSSYCVFFVVAGLVLLSTANLEGNTRVVITLASLMFGFLVFYFYYQMLQGKDFFGKFFRATGLHKTKKGRKVERKLRDFESLVIDFYNKGVKHFYGAVLITAFSWVFMYLEYKFALGILGIMDPSVLEVFLIFSFVGIGYLLPIPMALGSLEASQVSVFKLVGLPAAAGVALSFIVRLKDLVWTALGFIALSFYGLGFRKTYREADSLGKEVERLKHDSHK